MSAYDYSDLNALEAWHLSPPWDRPGACIAYTGDECGCSECCDAEPWTREDQRLHESGL